MSPETVPSFTSPKTNERESSRSLLPWLIAGAVIAAVVGIALLTSHRKTAASGTVLALDPYAANLKFTEIQMSESASLSGAKVTYIDGHVRNDGARTVTGAELQVLFGNDAGQPAQVEDVPLTLIRTHEPYIDTEAVSAAPLAPGSEHEFRLAFEDIATNWNQQYPETHVTKVNAK